MKKIIYLIALTLFVFSCEKITEKDLPAAAQTFISTHFTTETYSHGEKDKDDGVVEYEVTLSNGVDLVFDESGEWLSIDCEYSTIPSGIVALLPTDISVYFDSSYPEYKMLSIEKEMGGYQISINNATGDFYFSSTGEFIRHDPTN